MDVPQGELGQCLAAASSSCCWGGKAAPCNQEVGRAREAIKRGYTFKENNNNIMAAACTSPYRPLTSLTFLLAPCFVHAADPLCKIDWTDWTILWCYSVALPPFGPPPGETAKYLYLPFKNGPRRKWSDTKTTLSPACDSIGSCSWADAAPGLLPFVHPSRIPRKLSIQRAESLPSTQRTFYTLLVSFETSTDQFWRHSTAPGPFILISSPGSGFGIALAVSSVID